MAKQKLVENPGGRLAIAIQCDSCAEWDQYLLRDMGPWTKAIIAAAVPHEITLPGLYFGDSCGCAAAVRRLQREALKRG